MIKSSLISLNTASKKVEKDPFKRLSLAIRELDKLINRANQLAHLSEQPSPPLPANSAYSDNPFSKVLTGPFLGK